VFYGVYGVYGVYNVYSVHGIHGGHGIHGVHGVPKQILGYFVRVITRQESSSEAPRNSAARETDKKPDVTRAIPASILMIALAA
jgi:hypothetical protein